MLFIKIQMAKSFGIPVGESNYPEQIQHRGSLSGLPVGYPTGYPPSWACNRTRISKNCFQTGTGYGSGYPNAFIDVSRI